MNGLVGLFAPLVTPFTDDGSSVSDVRLSRLVRHLLEIGIQGFVTTSDTGEFLATSFAERKLILEIVLRECRSVPVLAHVSAMSTSASLDLAQHAMRHGARGVVLMPPYYGRYSNEEVARYFETIATFANTPVIVVDPLERIDEELRTRLSQIPMIHFSTQIPQPNPHTTYSDSFCLDGIVVTPAALLMQKGDMSRLDSLIREHSGKRICKAGLEILDMDVGSPRSPAGPVNLDVMTELRAILGAS